MSAKKEILDIVDENDKVIGQASREKIHNEGLLHREVHVLFFTDNGEIIFQKRSHKAETFPGLLDATVGGHVDLGEDYITAALRETEEETGLKITLKDLVPLEKQKIRGFDQATNLINYKFTQRYAYMYTGDIKDLKVNPDESICFERWSISQLLNIQDNERKYFIPSLLQKEYIDLYLKIQKLIK